MNDGDTADTEPSPFTKAVHATMLRLFNCQWPKGAGDQFGHTEHMVGWLEYILEIPDTFAITRGTASGNLSVTVQKEQSEVGQYDWALRRYHSPLWLVI